MNAYFLHGLESSGQGTKGTYLKQHFPAIHCPDFHGTLQERLAVFEEISKGKDSLLLIGSSYGGLMATCFAIRYPDRVARLVLLAPALNFEGFTPPEKKIDVPVRLYMGKHDDVCPPVQVGPLAEGTFTTLETIVADDDHMLHNTFRDIDWQTIFS